MGTNQLPMADTSQAKPKRRDIQGIRGVAIIYVLIFHLRPKLYPHGFLGVDMFFVISGFLITMILRREKRLTVSDVLIFFKKRIKRIFPAYYVVLLMTLVYGYVALTTTDYRLLQTDALWAIGFATNFHKYFQNLDYFAQISNFDLVLHTWSLAVEIQFYIIAPILVLLSKHFLGKYFACGAIFLGSAYFNITATGPLQFSSLFSRIWQFMCGSIAYIYPTELESPLVLLPPLLIISPVVLLFPVNDTVLRFLVTFSAAFIISANHNLTNNYLLGNSVLYFIGEISYSIYLFHWPVVLFLKYSSNLDELQLRDVIIAAEVSLLLGYLSYKYIERKFLESRFLYTVLFLVLSISAMCCMTLIRPEPTADINLSEKITSPQVTGQKTRFEKQCYQFLDIPYLPQNVTQQMRDRALVINRLYRVPKVPVLKDINHLFDPLLYKYFKKKNAYIQFPDYFTSTGTLKIVVFGNSFARSGFHPVINAFRDHIKEIRLLSTSACQPFLNSTKYATGRYIKVCPDFVKQSIALIEEMKPDIVFFLYMPYFGVIRQLDNDNIETDEQMIVMQKTIDRVAKAAKVILLQMPLPAADKGYTDLLIKVLEKRQSFEGLYMEFPAFRERFRYGIKRMEHLHCDKCVKIYAHRIYCDSKICRVFDPDNLVTFYDHTNHLSEHAQKCLTRLYRDTLDELFVDKRFDEG